MSIRTVLVVVLALVFGGSAAVGVNSFRARAPVAAAPETVPVVVAAVDIPRYTTVSSDLLTIRDFPKDLAPPGALAKLEDAADRVTFSPLVKDEAVLAGKLAAPGTGRGMAAIIPKGMQAITIQTPNVATGVAGFILPGNKVDVLLTVNWRDRASDTTGGGSTMTLLQGIEILAVDQRVDAPAENKVDPKELRSVTLLVTPAQGAKLTLAQNQGTLHLALRNPQDTLVATTKPVTLADFKFSEEHSWRGMAAATADGMRAMTIQTSNVAEGLGGFAVPGNRVDVMMAIGAASTTLLQNVEVLGVDSRADTAGDKGELKEEKVDPKTDSKSLRYLNVTLLVPPVPPDAAPKLALAQKLAQDPLNKATLHLSLRNPVDKKSVSGKAWTTLADLGVRDPANADKKAGSTPWATLLAQLLSEAAKAKTTAAPPAPKVVPTAWVRTLRGVHEGGVRLRPGEAPEER